MADQMTLHEIAEELGVHYMTVYRYVRLGQLDAVKRGGAWRVDPEALERFRSAGKATTVRGDRSVWAKRLLSRLLVGDMPGAWGVVEACLASGADLEAIYDDLLGPAMREIGAKWERGEIDIGIEHRASGMAMRIIGRLGSRFLRRGRRRGSIVIGAPAGEQHSLPVVMLGDLMRSRGWGVSELGADVPAMAFARMVRESDDTVGVGLSVTYESSLVTAAATCDVLRAEADDVCIVAGGAAVFDDEIARQLGADAWASDADGFDAILEGELSRRRGSSTATSTG